MKRPRRYSAIKRFLLFNTKHFSYLLKVFFIIILFVTIYFSRSSLDTVLLELKLKKEDNLEITIVSVFLGLLTTSLIGLVKVSSIQRKISQWLIRVNTNINTNHLEDFFAYDDTVSSRIRRKILPEELQEAWKNDLVRNRYLIPVRAEEIISPGIKNAQPGYIEDLLLFLDLDLFVNSEELVPPFTVQGDPGSGKSTLIFELFRQHAMRLRGKKQGWIPILVFGHELSWDLLEKQESLQGLLADYFKRSIPERDRRNGYESILHLIEEQYDKYQFLIIIDGLDEITNRPLYERITTKLNELLEREWKHRSPASAINRYIVSCRTDDNQRIITSRLISVLPVDYARTVKHLRSLERLYWGKGSSSDANRTRLILRGLKISKTDRLLQNYISNPYLLSLILKYYSEEMPQAQTLKNIFDEVLERELRKPRKEFEEEEIQKARASLRPYLSSLLAPYCYRRIIDTMTDEQHLNRGFRAYIEEDEILSGILFGDAQYDGYIKSFFHNNTRACEDGFLAIAKEWGYQKASQFRGYLAENQNPLCSIDEFAAKATRWLHNDVLLLLKGYNLAELDEAAGEIKRFRHRRMQDYFMAIFIDRVGMNVGSRPRLMLENAWMREPIRILAAISSHPEELLDSFLKSYEVEKQVERQNTSPKTVDLLLNASEAISYLPRPDERVANEAVYKLVDRLGQEAQTLYFNVARTLNETSVQNARKCLTILRNIYASEFLRNDETLSNTSIDNNHPSRRGFWEALHWNIQQSPDFFQHDAYVSLYPIKRAQQRFPLSNTSLFFYVLDEVFCFPGAYNRLIAETHPEPRKRALIACGYFLETLLSLLIVFSLLRIPWVLNDIFPTFGTKIITTGIIATVCFIMALVAHWFGFMDWVAFYHIVTWALLKLFKRVWVAIKLLGTDLQRVLKRLLQQMKHEVALGFRWLVRKPLRPALILLSIPTLIFGGRFLVRNIIPAIEYQYGKWQYSSKTSEFLSAVKGLYDKDHEYLNQIQKLMTSTNAPVDSEELNDLKSKLDEEKDEVTDLISRGQYLIDTSLHYSDPRSDEINRWQDQLIQQRDSLGKLQENLINKEKSIRQATRLNAYKKDVEGLRKTVQQFAHQAVNGLPTLEMQRYFEEASKAKAMAEALVKEGESLEEESSNKDETSPLIREAKELYESLQEKASLLSTELGKVSPAGVPEVNKIVEETLQSKVANRSEQALQRTTLIDNKEKLQLIEEYVRHGETKFEEIKNEINYISYKSYQVWFKYQRLSEYLNYVNRLTALESELSVLTLEMNQYGAELRSILEDSKELPNFESWRDRIRERLSEVQGLQANQVAFEVILKLYSENHIPDNLTRTHKEVSEQFFSLMFFFSLCIGLGVLIWFAVAFYRKFVRDKKGEKEIDRIQDDFGRLLRFIETNGYSFRINAQAIAYLKQIAPPTYDSWKAISEVAWLRHSKPGDTNRKIGESLDEVAIGIDIRLNHQIPIDGFI